uniref:Uncharacterized protein n=1 Tax=Tolypocladium cylindrosporum TaxID=38005 RepID=A0A6G7P011_9HYPO|nr:hypothetical protein [Tolypocladium cylindrosporum]QIJ60557.1 hypothetical protein [Tolypocladium cylindrosporum]
MLILKKVKIIYIIIIAIAIFNIFNVIFGNVVYCDTESISELYFAEDNIPNTRVEPNESRFSTGSTFASLDLRERMRRKISWYLYSKKFISYSEYKQNWYPSRSVRKQIKIEFKDFIRNPYKYSVHEREWLLIDNCKYYKDNPNGTFFVQGMGYLEARYVHYLTVKYGYVVHNNRFVKVNIKDIGAIITKIHINK